MAASRMDRVLDVFFRWVVAHRIVVLIAFAILVVPATYFAVKVKQDNAPERLAVATDPDVQKNAQFEKQFGKTDPVVLFLDAADPLDPQVLAATQQLQFGLQALSGVDRVISVLSFYDQFRAVRMGVDPAKVPPSDFVNQPEQVEALKRFALPSGLDPRLGGTDLFVRQGLLFPGKFLSLQVLLSSETAEPAVRHALLQNIDAAAAKAVASLSGRVTLRKVGQAYVNDHLDRDTRSAGMWGFGLFALFLIALNWFLYRSLRTLIAFLLPLLVSTVFTVAFVVLVGGKFTIVSALIPMTILVTSLATLVYIQSRFVERPLDSSVDEHQIFSLKNKFLACTASIFATAVGFAALVVSKIPPIRDMGLWVAAGLFFSWIVLFTLFPALQKLLKTPTQAEKKVAGQWFEKLVARLPRFGYRFRWLLVALSLVWMALGAVALLGIPGWIPRMKLETSPIEYINHGSALYKDTKSMEGQGQGGLFAVELWLSAKRPDNVGAVIDFRAMQAWNGFARALETTAFEGHHPSVVDLSMLMRMLAYVQTGIDPVLGEPTVYEKMAEQLEQQMARSPALVQALATYTNPPQFTQTRMSLYTKTLSYDDYQRFVKWVRDCFERQKDQHAVLVDFDLHLVGRGPMQAKISHHLVPTLTESFLVSVVIIFATFLVVFRSGAARIMALIPSLFAILAMFSIMRLTGIPLNIATILIATTVLGTSENDQIHFFYHYQEKKKAGGTTEEALQHTFLVAGRAIFFATLINAVGFLAFVFSGLPPIRQFGLLTSLAFVLSMVADFTALPAALWLVFRQKPTPARGQAPTS